MTAHNLARGSAPVALLLLDVINDLEWEGGELLVSHFEAMAPQLAALTERARAAGIPVIYVNDNYGQWRSDVHSLVRHCLDDGVRGQRVVSLLQPAPDDYFVLKPMHSGFFATTLELLLRYLGARTLVLTGVAGNICVLFTANDAHMRGFRVVAPADCLASNTPEDNAYALDQMRKVMSADTTRSSDLDLRSLLATAGT